MMNDRSLLSPRRGRCSPPAIVEHRVEHRCASGAAKCAAHETQSQTSPRPASEPYYHCHQPDDGTAPFCATRLWRALQSDRDVLVKSTSPLISAGTTRLQLSLPG